MIDHLYQYQRDVIDQIRTAFREGHRAIMLYSPCGGGKTEMAISFLDATEKNNNGAAMVLDRVVLVEQTSKRMDKYGINHGILQSGSWRYKPHEKIQICSAQTLEARGSFPNIKLLIVDEAHCQRKETIEFIKNNPSVRVIGLSGSPFTKGLGAIYSKVVSSITIEKLVEQSYLCPLRVYIAKEIDMTGAKKVAGEWSQKESTERGIKITGDIVSEWVKKTHEIFGEPRKTVVFCAGVAHGEDLSRQFMEAGYNFVNISYKDNAEYKSNVIEDFAKPDSGIDGVIATDVLTKGFDNNLIDIMISARPFTKSFNSHVQQLGRGMRMYEGKKFGVLLDHSGNFLRFQDQWEELYANGVSVLDDGAEKPQKEPTKNEKEAAKCPKCGAIWPPHSDICSHCGMVRVRKNDVVAVAGEMMELDSPKSEKYPSEYKELWYQTMIGILRENGRNENRAYHLYFEKFGIVPCWKKIANLSGDARIDCQRDLQRANIAYSKRTKP